MKILLVHATAGAGHLKAAEAVYNWINKHTDHDVKIIDALDYSNKFFKNSYRSVYVYLITKLPAVWGVSFAFLDIPILQPIIRFLRMINNSFNAAKLHKHLKDEQYDCVISTHFLSTEVAARLKRKGVISSKLITVVTDYDVHRIWLAKGVDVYAVATDWTKNKLESLGVDEQKIKVTGIPSDERFSVQYDRMELKNKLGLKEDVFTVLIATGSFGIGPIEDIIENLEEFQVIVVSGHNKNLFERLSAKNYHHVKVLGLVDNMYELMAVSDSMVTKPGGMSITESLVSNLPMIFFNPIPGQETNNIMVLSKYGIGVKGLSIDDTVSALQKYKSSRDAFFTALNNTKTLARPTAAQDIVSLIS